MAIWYDPEEIEIGALLEYVGSFAGQRVLEIGAGIGRLTWRYADQAAHVTAIDPNESKIAIAKDDLRETLQDKVTLLPVGVERFELPSGAPEFDVAILSWVL